jgi:hypothetical protein
MGAIAYKEWLKLRGWLGFILTGHLLFGAWLVLSVRHHFRIEHAEMLFYQANHIGRLFYDDLRYVPLLTGALLGAAQFLPELIRGRLRLSLHLPVGAPALVFGHLAVGLGALAAFLLLDMALLAATIGVFFPAAFVTSALLTAAPWMLAGVAAYLGAALVLLEPSRRHQAGNLAVAGGVVMLCHLSTQYQAYDRALAGLALVVLLLAPACLQAVCRFRSGGV